MTLKDLKSFALIVCGGDKLSAEEILDELPTDASDDFLMKAVAKAYEEKVTECISDGQLLDKFIKVSDRLYLIAQGGEESILHIKEDGRIVFYKKSIEYKNLGDYNSMF